MSKKRNMLLVLCLVLVTALVSVGGTIAWITTKTTPVVNTFTVGDIDIELEETKSDFEMIPGNTIAKDPKVTVLAGSEECYLFVKVEESTNLGTYIEYTIDSGWTQLKDASGNAVAGVYYREVTAEQVGTAYSVLAGDSVTVKTTVTKEDLAAAETTAPTLTFTAYAVQKANVANAYTAWGYAASATVPETEATEGN